jgi:O-6-methylguanine DNA methyltransferase
MERQNNTTGSLLYYDFYHNGLLIRIVADSTKLVDVTLEYAKTNLYSAKNIASGENGIIKKAVHYLEHYFRAESFTMPPLDLSGFTENERRVYETLMKVPFGETVSYGNLALRAGFPNAARFVGSTMRKNRFPIFIPCHRVIPAAGGIGNFSPDPRMKSQLIRFEREVRGKADFQF